MAEKTIEKIEREYTIPLREKVRSTVIYKKTPKAIKSVKEFVARHMRVQDRDLKKVKLDKFLNEFLWFRGIRNPPHKIKVKVVKEGDVVRVYPLNLPKKLDFKKKREEKKSKEQKKIGDKKKKEIEEKRKDEENKEKAELEKIEEKSGVPKEVAKSESDLEVKESKKIKPIVSEKNKEESNKIESQKEMKEESKEKKVSPKKGKEKIAELRKEDKTSRGH